MLTYRDSITAPLGAGNWDAQTLLALPCYIRVYMIYAWWTELICCILTGIQSAVAASEFNAR